MVYVCIRENVYLQDLYITEKVNRLKLARLHTSASDSAKIYRPTIVEIGTKSSQMTRKRIHKFHNILWNAYCYLKRRIMGFDRYLHMKILSWRNQRPLASPPPPPGMVYIRRTGIVECQNGSIHSHSMVSVMSLLLNLLFSFCMQLFRLGHLTVCLVDMLCGIIALKLIWLYNSWHEYVPLPIYQISTRRKSTDSSCHILLTLVSLFSLSCFHGGLQSWLRGSLPDQLGVLYILSFYCFYLSCFHGGF